MQKTGQILNAVATQRGGYQSQNGWIYTYDMTIQCQDGQFTGEIGAKSQPYPLAAGQQISVEVTNSQNGVKFKKFNPQFAPQQGQQQGQQQPQQAPQQARQAAKSDQGVDWDKISRGKCRHGLLVAQVSLRGVEAITPQTLDKILELTEFSMTGKHGQIPMEQFVDENPVEQDDQIPWENA